VEFEGRRLDGESFDPFDKAAPIGASAKLAIGHDREADLFLHPDRVADALILNLQKHAVVDASADMVPKRLAKPWRAKQAADMIGAEWRLARRSHGRIVLPMVL
jgi:hypothetical protein